MNDQNQGFQERINAKIKEITDRYQPQIQALEARGKQLADDFSQPDTLEAIIDVDFTVEWKDVDIIFDLPSVSMRTQESSLDIPEVSMVQNTIVFHTPSVRMVDRKVGQYPEIDGWTVRWHDIIISIPEPFMQEQRIVLGLPSVTMKRQDWKIDLPEFKMEQQHWKIGLPQFTAKKISVETQRMTQAGKQLQAEGETLGERMKAEISAAIGFGQASVQQASAKVSNDILQSFDSAIAALTQSIKELEAKGIDPIKVPSETGDINLRKQLEELINQRAAAAQATSEAPPAPPAEPAQAAA